MQLRAGWRNLVVLLSRRSGFVAAPALCPSSWLAGILLGWLFVVGCIKNKRLWAALNLEWNWRKYQKFIQWQMQQQENKEKAKRKQAKNGKEKKRKIKWKGKHKKAKSSRAQIEKPYKSNCVGGSMCVAVCASGCACVCVCAFVGYIIYKRPSGVLIMWHKISKCHSVYTQSKQRAQMPDNAPSSTSISFLSITPHPLSPSISFCLWFCFVCGKCIKLTSTQWP